MRTLSIDIETYCGTDIKTCGAYKYAEDVEIILFAYSADYAPVKVVDLLSGEEIPKEIFRALTDPEVIKVAFNAAFEIEQIQSYFGITLDPHQWRCTMVRCAMAGYPLSLGAAGKALGIDEQKLTIGKDLIRFFCVPCKPTKANGFRTRNYPEHAPDKWEEFKRYNVQDVVAEMEIAQKLAWVKIPRIEHELWCLDQEINARGVKIYPKLANMAIKLDADFRERMTREYEKVTGMPNPNALGKLKDWIKEIEGIEVKSLDKDHLPLILEKVKDERVKRALVIRQEMGKTSVGKYKAILNMAGWDDRTRGLFQYYGANRTGRWAGRGLQAHNLPRINLKDKDLDIVRNLVLEGNSWLLEVCYGSVPAMLSELIRTCFIAEKGKKLIPADFSAIEARVIAWLAGEQWRLDVFNSHGKIYEASASMMFKVPLELIKKPNPEYELRQKGKVAELACGFQGGVKALERAAKGGIPKKQLRGIIKSWRAESPNIVQLWRDLEQAAKEAVITRKTVTVGDKGVSFRMENGALLFRMPSGRDLHYPGAAVETIRMKIPKEVPLIENGLPVLDEEGDPVMKEIMETVYREVVTFYGLDQETKRWSKQATYGGKLTENLVQATARDCLAHGMLTVAAAGYPIVLHVHDELVIETELDTPVEKINSLLCQPASWMKGLPLKAAGYETDYYKKD